MKKTTIAILTLILTIAFFIRIWHIATDPPGLTWDEAAHGYNAYSILKTGKDEYGTVLPLTLKSFGDYKPALFTYTLIPSIAVLGLTETAVRLPSVVFGTVIVLLTYLLVKKIFENEVIGLVSAGVVAFSLWAIQFSRGAWEANMALLLILAGTYCFMRALDSSKWLMWSGLLLTLSLYTYQSSRLFVPLLVIGLMVLYRKEIFLRKATVIAAIVSIILLVPFVLTMLDPANRQRLVVQNLFAYQQIGPGELATIASEDNVATNSATMQLYHSQAEAWTKTLVAREFTYLNPGYLFVTGDTSARHRPPFVAHGYFVDIVFYVVGFYALATRKWRHKKVIYLWLLLAPLPAVFSRDLTSALRSLQLVFAVDVLIALGLWLSWENLKKWPWRLLFLVVVGALYLFNFLFYLDAYYVHYPKRAGKEWLVGYKEAMTAIKPIYQNYQNVVFTTDYNEPYIFFLFYNKVDPATYQQQAKLTATRGVDVGEVEQFQNISFRHINWPADRNMKQSLFIGTEEELPAKDIGNDGNSVVLEPAIRLGDGTTAFKIVQTK